MNAAFAALCVVGALVAAPVFAQDVDPLKPRLDRCVADNASPKVSPTIVSTYCACMSEKMGPTEKKSVTKWEEAHKPERKACEKAAGWL